MPNQQPAQPSGSSEHAKRPPALSRRGIGWIVASFLASVAVDLVAPWPYVMTPLYAVPVLVAAEYGSPRTVALVAALATAINILSAVIQGTPTEIWTFYTIGLVITGYVALRLAHERREAARRADEAEEARDHLRQFMGMVAHDLRSPLTALVLHTGRLRRRFAELPPDEQQRAIATIHSAADRMKRLTTDLLDTSRVLTGHFLVEPSPADLAAVVREVVALRQAASPEHTIALVAPHHLEGVFDQDRVAQMLGNLISNATKYSPEHTTVRVAVVRQGANAVVQVSDSGPGIPSEELDGLFRPFTRLDRDRHVEGTGLGLSISQAIAQAHGGGIRVESQPGSGSTFSIVLPLAPGTGVAGALPESLAHRSA